MYRSDVLIIGAGPGGYEMAAALARAGKSVTVIERDKVGGTCLNRGCIPTKALAASAEILASIRNAATFGITVTDVVADYSRAHARAMEVVDTLREDVTSMLRDINVVHGEARFTGNHEVAVDDEVYTADKILIATGSKPAPLRCKGAEHAIDSDTLLSLSQLPASPVVIVGGGVIGMEFACILNAFGVDVKVVEFCKEILPGMDAELAKRLRTTLTRQGIEIYCSTTVQEITVDGHVLCTGRKGDIAIEAVTVIAAVGRRPVLPQGLENTDIHVTERGFIDVDSETFATSVDGVYAVGDVNGHCMLAHAAAAQAKVAAGFNVGTAIIPAVVFTTPQMASVGTHDGAVAKVPYGSNGKALADGAEGLVKLVYDADTEVITGCHVIGEHAADIVAEAAVAISQKMTRADLGAIIHAHPSISELLSVACSA